jgi:hypothetical protein
MPTPRLVIGARREGAVARETLIEAVKFGDTAPDSIQVTHGEGHEVVAVFLDRLLR